MISTIFPQTYLFEIPFYVIIKKCLVKKNKTGEGSTFPQSGIKKVDSK